MVWLIKSKYLSTNIASAIIIGLTLFVVAGGCTKKPQFIPEQLAGRQSHELALLATDRTKDIFIDEEKAKSNLIYLAPGPHSIQYKVYEETEEWKSFVSSMNNKGFSLCVSRMGKLTFENPWCRSKGSKSNIEAFFDSSTRFTVAAVPSAMLRSRYGWIAKIKQISLRPGRRYALKDL
ncbi:MAG: hypothetical protein KKE44_26245 [Proteobacteria bacterium]|nr:hypothetical protein [Pseudomonadota bacterium]MBU1586232.1 hypothetical protein [Pseudomonadota bacterium]MBU2452149.1 hypothetical protein [Pseudomonadota bacterium]